MTLQTAAIIDAVSTDADALRRAYKLLSGGLQGVAVEGDLKVTTSSGMISVIAAGDGLVNGTQNTVTQGSYGIKNDAAVSQTHAASDPTNPRNDLVGIKIEDAFYSGANKQATPVIVTGTPAASPADPAAPANYLPLARVRVNAGASTLGTITDLRTRLGGTKHRLFVWQSAAQSIGNAAFVNMPFDQTDEDPDVAWDNVNRRYTCPVSGRYLFIGGMVFNGSPAQSIFAIGKNSSTEYVRLAAAGALGVYGMTMLSLVAGDQIYPLVYQSSGGTMNTLTGRGLARFEVQYLGAAS